MPNLYDNIDRYLDGSMSETEKQIFEDALNKDPDLGAAVRRQQNLVGFFGAYEPELEKKLEELGATYFKPPTPNRRLRTWFVVGSVVLGGACVWLFFNQKNTTPLPTAKPAEQQKIAPEQKTTPIPTGDSLLVVPEKVSPPPRKSEVAPIAAADAFEPNPLLESLIRENVRSDAFQLSVTSPPPYGTLELKDGRVLLALEGTITQNEALTVVLYNNRTDAFQKNYPVFNEVIRTQPAPDSDVFLIKSQFNLELPAGIYYLLLLPTGKNDILYIANFGVR